MDNEILLSVIIPVYNVEKYLKKCLDSVLNQEFKNFEIICIDDCSTDSSLKILKEYAKSNERIKVLQNNTNLGLGLTRNIGLNAAMGKYIHFLDSDDFLNKNTYNIVNNTILEFKNIDIFVFSYDIFNEKTKKTIKKEILLTENLFYRKVNFLAEPEISNVWEFPVWIKIVKKEFLEENNLFFNDNRCQEDVEFSMLLLLKADSIVFNKQSLLTYRENRKSSLVLKRSKYLDLLVNDISDLENSVSTYPIDIRQKFLAIIYSHLIICAAEAFYKRCLSFKDLKKLINKKISVDLLKSNNKYCYHVSLYNKIVTYNELQFRVSYCLREFIKKNFPNFVMIYFLIKRIIWCKNE